MSHVSGERELTPGEEALFANNPKLRQAMEDLEDEEIWREIERTQLEVEIHLENARRMRDGLKR